MNKMDKSEEEWKKELTPAQYHVLREKGTDRPFTGELLEHEGDGMYKCAACGAELFTSDAKFDSGTGWPSFDAPVSEGKIRLEKDMSMGVERTEVICNTCGGHLGHVFEDGPTKTCKRFCINSSALNFDEKK